MPLPCYDGPDMIQDLIARYNDAFDDELAADTHGELGAALARENLVFGGRPLCNVLRPQLLTEDEYASIQVSSAQVLSALRRAYDAMQADPALREVVAPSALEEAAMAVPTRYDGPTPFSRLDAFFSHDDGGLRFVEYNAETPAGVGYEDVLGRIFLALEPVRRLAGQVKLRALEGSDSILDVLLELHREAGVAQPPAIAVVDWADVPTKPEHEILARHFQGRGVPAACGAPDELAYRSGTLYLCDAPVSIVYKRVLGSEFLEACGLEHPLVAALSDGAAVMANPFRCKLLHKKAVFALLSDERYAHLYTEAERRAIGRHVPWTRRVEDRRTTFGPATVDLLPWADAHREWLVLKPNDDYGGRGVVLGWEVDGPTWARALADGLSSPAVVQERIATTPEDFPVWDGRALAIEPRLVDLDPFVYRGAAVHGLLTRLSAGALLNVSAGAGSVAPTFVVDGPQSGPPRS